MRRLIVFLSGLKCDIKAAQTAAILARRLGAQLEGIFIAPGPTEDLQPMCDGFSSRTDEPVHDVADLASQQAAQSARAVFEEAASTYEIDIVRELTNKPGAAAKFFVAENLVENIIDRECKLADLVIFGEAGDGAPPDWMARIERVLLGLRRPVLIARGAVAANFGEKILLAYNGSPEATNALRAALPVLAAGGETEILEVHESERSGGHAKEALGYLVRAGVNATAHDMRLARAHTGDEICARANSIWAGLIIIGGYGRSRLREFILGGVTRFLVYHAPVPVLLVH